MGSLSHERKYDTSAPPSSPCALKYIEHHVSKLDTLACVAIKYGVEKSIASPGHGILAVDESNATCGKRLASIGLENTEQNRQAYRQLLLTTSGLGAYISGAILYEETLYQSTIDGKKFVDCLHHEKIMPSIKVDKGLVPLPGSNNESWCQGLDGLASRCAEYYKHGARFAKWRTAVSIPSGPSTLVVKEAAWGLARYAAIAQVAISLHQLKSTNSSTSKKKPAEKYIQVVSVDNHEFWFMGFMHYDSAVKSLQDALHDAQNIKPVTTASSV
ncbi:hypothetical protein ZIOFF_060312 [Zingiber officinale]|uniref:fructose-bisphosphate aldolase n=1 Tax=Zingiber officinale TaxID=94328 RepID=A0A8J5KC16_ZINOF|nr:hypothetical protein ZIOFF_060312 [Zingiber officinale]